MRILACVILECFVNFLDDPYYEPLPWFMILAQEEEDGQLYKGEKIEMLSLKTEIE